MSANKKAVLFVRDGAKLKTESGKPNFIERIRALRGRRTP